MGILIERLALRREHGKAPEVVGRSAGIDDSLAEAIVELATLFGDRPAGVSCPGALFAQPLDGRRVAVVEVRDIEPGPDGWPGLRFDTLTLRQADYEGLGGDPFALAAAVRTATQGKADGPTLAAVSLPATPFPPRGVDEVQRVLKRIKAGALREGADPETTTITVDNAESPMLLGAAQVLVDGGKIVLERPRPDAGVVEALWTLLPHSLRPKLWPATFAFSNALGFDVLCVPRLSSIDLSGYTTEEQAGDYPAGSYEMALQSAAESGNPRELEAVFRRRTSGETLLLAGKLLIGMSLLVAAINLWKPQPRIDPAARAASAAGVVGVRDPWSALQMIDLGNHLYKKRTTDAD